jgi:glycosyltransferase involved in cell wall biosynthesis
LKKVISIFVPSLAGGGAERVAIYVAETLKQAGYEVDLVYARAGGPLRDHPVVHALGVCLNAPNEMLCLPHLVGYLRRRKPDLMIALVHSAKIMAGLACRIYPQTRLVISVHNNLLAPRRYRFWLRRWFGFGLERRLYAHVTAAHSVSLELAEQTSRCFGIPPEKSFTIYNPTRGQGDQTDIPPAHLPLFDRPVILSAGRLVPQKDHASLIRSFAASGLAGQCRLLILGEGPLRAELEQQVKQAGLEGAIVLPGRVPDVRPYLAHAACYALSSRFEGMSLAMLEAMQAGLPIVSYACSCGPAEILDNGRLGHLIKPGDEVGFAQALRAVINKQGPLPSPQEIEAKLRNFAPEIIAAQYVELVEYCLSRPPRKMA